MTHEIEEKSLKQIKDSIKSYPDFPKKGICFFDIFSILEEPGLTSNLLSVMEARIRKHAPNVDVIIGLDSRGFLFGLPLAMALKKPFVPIRKKGKLPGETNSVTYKLEYGEDTMEIQKSSLTKGQSVVIIDDLLATGGTLLAANELVAKGECKTALNLLCIELPALKGRDRIATPVQSLLQF